MKHVIKSERLLITSRTAAEMRELIGAEKSAEMKQAYGEMLSGIESHPRTAVWHARLKTPV